MSTDTLAAAATAAVPAPAVHDAVGTVLHPDMIVEVPNGDRVQVVRTSIAPDGRRHPLVHGVVVGGPWHGLAVVHRARNVYLDGFATGPAPTERASDPNAAPTDPTRYDRTVGAIVNSAIDALMGTVGWRTR